MHAWLTAERGTCHSGPGSSILGILLEHDRAISISGLDTANIANVACGDQNRRLAPAGPTTAEVESVSAFDAQGLPRNLLLLRSTKSSETESRSAVQIVCHMLRHRGSSRESKPTWGTPILAACPQT